MAMIEWVFSNLFVLFALVAFASSAMKWIGKFNQTMREEKQPLSIQVQTNDKQEEEKVEPLLVREEKSTEVAVSVSKESEKPNVPVHSKAVIQGIIFSEIIGPPRAKKPFRSDRF
jgi:Sec-independent protein translocase protein TatA